MSVFQLVNNLIDHRKVSKIIKLKQRTAMVVAENKKNLKKLGAWNYAIDLNTIFS